MKKLVDGIEVDMSAEEIAARASEEAAEAATAARRAILATISALEATVTPRRLREAVTTDAGKAWLADLDAQIAAERSKL